jgi:hypothetical protein
LPPLYPETPLVERRGSLLVVRDDLCPGGTKYRALLKVLPTLGYREYVFTAPAMGYAQIALALACRELGYRACIFVAARRAPHPRTARAAAAGARIISVPAGRLSVLRARARAYCADTGALLFPMGFALPPMLTAFAAIARAVDATLPAPPAEVWAVAGSGALSRALQAAWPAACHFAVQIGYPPDVGGACLLTAPEPFAMPARRPPPFPSCSNYDAKAWQFLAAYAAPGALCWTVAG